MREETITKGIKAYIESLGWKVLSFDFPQSGTGVTLKRNNHENEKNRDTMNPDIIALKDSTLLVMENKVEFSKKDLKKLEMVKTGEYTKSIRSHFPDFPFTKMRVGVGLKNTLSNAVKIGKESGVLDFYILLNEDLAIAKSTL